MCKHKVKKCTHRHWSENMCARIKNMLRQIYASCAHVFAQNFKKIVLIVHYFVLTLSLKFHKDSSFFCGDICQITLNMHTRGINACAHILMHTCACFLLVCARMCIDLYQNFITGPLLYYEPKFHILQRSKLQFRRYLQNINDIGLIINFDFLYFHSYAPPKSSKVNN